MCTIMATIAKTLSSRRRPDGTAEVYFRFSAGRGATYRMKTGIYVPVDKWNPDTQSLIIPRLATPEQRRLADMKRKITSLERALLEQYADATAGGGTVNGAWFVEKIKTFHNPDYIAGGPVAASLAVRDLLPAYIDQQSDKGRYVTSLEALLVHVRAYESESRRALTVDGWTEEDIARFEAWLHGGRGFNTVVGYLRLLRSFSYWCVRNKYTRVNPFATYRVPDMVFGTPYYLTIEERDRIYDTYIANKRTREQRDIFIFQCFVGCRVSDLAKLTKSSVVDGALEYIPAKTAGRRGRVVRVPLTKTAREIIDRYADLPGPALLPFRSVAVYNIRIRMFFTAAGITRPVTVLDPRTRREVQRPLNEIASSHLARRTFIGNLYKQVKDPNLIGALSGHTDGSRAFARYRTIDDEMKAQVVGLLEK